MRNVIIILFANTFRIMKLRMIGCDETVTHTLVQERNGLHKMFSPKIRRTEITCK